MKAYTDLSQSIALGKFLPLESADGFYESILNPTTKEWDDILVTGTEWASPEVVIPAWSLAALLDVLPKIINNETLFIETSAALWHIGYRNVYIARADNPVDACVAMILKLKERNLL